MRRHGKRDRNHSDVVGWYRDLGCSVHDCADMGNGFPDILVGIDGEDDKVEIKYGDAGLTSDQITWHRDWKGRRPVIVRTHTDVVIHVGNMRKRARQ